MAATVASAAVVSTGASMKMAADFERQMALVRTQAGDTEDNLGQLKQAVLDLAPAVGIGPEELAKGLFHITSLGLRGKEAIDTLKMAAEGAATGMASLEDVANVLGGTMRVGMSDIHNASEAMGVLNAIVGAGNMRMDALAAALSTGILPVAKNFGVTMRETGAAIAVMTDESTPAEVAAHRLRMSISLLAAPSQQASKELQLLGINSTDLATHMRHGGIIEALEFLQSHIAKSGKSAVDVSQILSRAFGGGESSAGILTLLNNLDVFRGKLAQIKATTGDFQKSWEETKQQVAFQWDQLTASAQAAGIRVGAALLPLAAQFVAAITPAVSRAGDLLGTLAGRVASLGAGKIDVAQFSFAALRDLGTPLSIAAPLANRLAEAIASLHRTFEALEPPVTRLASRLATDIAPDLVLVFGWVRDLSDQVRDPLVRVLGFLADHADQVHVALLALIGLKTAQWAASSAKEALIFANTLKTNLVDGVGAVRKALIVLRDLGIWVQLYTEAAINWAKTTAIGIASAMQTAASWVAAQVEIAAGWVAAQVKTIASFVAVAASSATQAALVAARWAAAQAVMLAIRTATILWTAAQWLLNVALSANPIGIVIMAVAALVAGVVWAYQNVGWFRDAVNAVWSTLTSFVAWVWSNLQPMLDWLGGKAHDVANAMGGIGSALGGIGGAVFGVPQMAAGAIVQKPTLALIGEAGAEAVVPLRQTGTMADIASYLPGGHGEETLPTLRRIEDLLKQLVEAGKSANDNQLSARSMPADFLSALYRTMEQANRARARGIAAGYV